MLKKEAGLYLLKISANEICATFTARLCCGATMPLRAVRDV